MKTTKFLALSMAVSMVLLAGCGSQPSNSSSSSNSGNASNSSSSNANNAPSGSKTDKQLVIGVSYQDLANEYIVQLQKSIEARAQEKGIKILEGDGKSQPEQQIKQVENYITQHVDAIILNPSDANGSSPAVEKAKDAGIPIITILQTVSAQDKATAHVGSDDVVSGNMEMTQIMKVLGGKGNIAIIHGPLGSSAEINRTTGNKNVLKDNPNVKVLAEQTANWSRSEALTLTENWLQTFPNLDGIVAQNDEMALGAVKAVEAAGKHIPVVGIDAVPDALNAVKDGKMTATVFQNAKAQGALVVDVAEKAAKGQSIEKNNFVNFELVTKENAGNYANK